MDIKKKSILLVAISIFLLVNVSLINAETFGYNNPTIPKLMQELFDGKPSSFYMPNNKTVTGDFSFDGLCINGGVEIKNGTICAQRLEVLNITNLNITLQDLTIINNLDILENLTVGGGKIILPSGTSTIEMGSGVTNFLVFDANATGSARIDFKSGSLAELRTTFTTTSVTIEATDFLGFKSPDDMEFRMTSAGMMTFNAAMNDVDIIFKSDTNTVAGMSDGGLFGGKGAWGFGRTASSSAFFFIQPIAFEAVANVDILALKVTSNGITVPAGTTSNAGTVLIDEPKLTADGTITNAFTLKIEGAPTEGTNNYALWVNSSGQNRFDGISNFTGLIYGNASQLTDIPSSADTTWIENSSAYNTSWSSTANSSYRTLTNHTFPYVIVQNNGTDNVIIGDATTGNNGLADSVVVIGHGAGASMLATGDDNVLVGFDAGAGLTTGSNNVLLGYKSGDGLTTSNNNVFIGINTGTNMTTSIGRNTLIGTNAGQYMSGNSNTAVGYLAGSAQGNVGSGGTYFGYQAGNKNTLGTSNLYLGNNAGSKNTVGSYNTYIGTSAGWQQVNKSSNTIIGYSAGYTLKSGSGNLWIGYLAGRYAVGSNNFAVGNQAGSKTGVLSPNMFVGNNAGLSLVGGTNNLFLGYNAGRYQTDINNTFIVDNFARGSKANDLARALIIGTFATLPQNQYLTFNANTNVVGNFDVNGSINQTSGNLTGNMIHGSMAFHNDTTGNVTTLTEDVWANFTGFDQESNEQMLNGISYSNSILTIQVGGVYDISFGTSFSGTVNNKYHVAIGINGVEQLFCESHDRISTGTDILSASFPCSKTLSVGDKLMLMYMNEDSAGDVTTLSAQLKANRVGN